MITNEKNNEKINIINRIKVEISSENIIISKIAIINTIIGIVE